MSDVKAFMIGPKAENLGLFRQLVLEALDDHLYWRRNHHPEDTAVLTNAERHSEEFKDFEDHLRDLLFRFLAKAKAGVPFFSPRYIGHMNTDLTIPSLVGYFGAMLYNQNNVAGESSPVTVELEAEVMVMLADMMGLPTSLHDGRRSAAGYLTSGGTAANVYALWVARNMRSWPLALRLALEESPEAPVAQALRDLQVNLGPAQGFRNVTELTYWELVNLPLGALYQIREDAFATLPAGDDPTGRTTSRKQVEELVSHHTLQYLGERRFFEALAGIFSSERDVIARPWSVIVSANKHYSWPKAADLLGLGQGALREVPHTGDFVMDTDALRQTLEASLENREPVLAVISLFGATEEGTLDDLAEIERVRSDLEARGLALWHHADACYGGYLGAMVRQDEGDAVCSAEELRDWCIEVGVELGLRHDEAVRLTHVSETEEGWLGWEDFISRVTALGRADSVSVDPHKLGYVPYPAGAVLFKDQNAWETVSFDAPYLWRITAAKLESMFVGRYTLEGSRAGATAASCWLAHKAIPLSQAGHGKLLAASFLGARRLLMSLRAASTEKVRIQPLMNPMTNMVCYVPIPSNCRSMEELKDLIDAVADDFSPTKPSDFMVVKTEVLVSCDDARSLLSETIVEDVSSSPGDVLRIPVLRSVVMSPFALSATQEDGPHLFDVFAKALAESAERHSWKVSADRFLKKLVMGPILVVEDDPAEREALLHELSIVFDRPIEEIQALVREVASTEEAALVVDEVRFPLRHVFLDIALQDKPKGGYDVYRRICHRNATTANDDFRVDSVTFLTHGDSEWSQEVETIEVEFAEAARPRRRYLPKPRTLSSDPAAQAALRDALLAAEF